MLMRSIGSSQSTRDLPGKVEQAPRNELLEAGILTAPRQGHIASSLPGFVGHVLTVADEP